MPEEKIEENELIKSSQVQDIQIVLDDIFPMISDLVYMYENLTFSRFGISVWSPVFIVNGTSYDNGNRKLNRKVNTFT